MSYKCEFKVGDLAYHKSNDKQRMVVTQIDEELDNDIGYEGIECTWISAKGTYEQEDFQPIELEKSVTL